MRKLIDSDMLVTWLSRHIWFCLLVCAAFLAALASIGHAYWQIAREVEDDLSELMSFIDTRLHTAEFSLRELDKLEFESCDLKAIELLIDFTFEHPSSGIFLTRPSAEQAKHFCTIHGHVYPQEPSTVLVMMPIKGKPKFELMIVEHLWAGRVRSDLFLIFHGTRRFNSVQIALDDSFAFLQDSDDTQHLVVSRLGAQYELMRRGLLANGEQWMQFDLGSKVWPIQLEAGIGGLLLLQQAARLLPFWLALFLMMAGLGGYVLRLREAVTAEKFRFHHALERNEFVAYFQPIVDVCAQKIVGSEALLRWCKADGTVISPAHFIPELERSELIQEVTQHLLLSLESQLAPILAVDCDFRCGVNLVPAQLQRPALADWLEDFSKEFDCRQLAFEITERLPITDMEAARHELKRIKELGIDIELDDAGTGYGGAAYLQELCIDVLKIDKLFVDTLMHSPNDTPVLDAYIRLGQSLGLKIIAEGVETEAQSAALLARGVSLQQGFLFAKPLPAKDFVSFYQGWRSQSAMLESNSIVPARGKRVLQ